MIAQIEIDIDKMFKMARFVENIFYIFVDREMVTVYNTYAVIIMALYLSLFLQIEHRKTLDFRQTRRNEEREPRH